jgi:hypothetical protein
MMTIQKVPMFSIPLAWDAHDQAQLNRQNCTSGQEKQVYLRTLAVYAVKYYLDCMGIQAQFDDQMNTVAWCNLSQAASVSLPSIGRVECVPVLPDSTIAAIPAESWGDRIAYIAVQFESTLRSATVLGYVETVQTEQIPITQFQQKTTDDLLGYLHQIEQKQYRVRQIQQLPVQLSQWFEQQFQPGWQPNAWRAVRTGQRQSHNAVSGFKLLDMEHGDEQIELTVGLSPLDANESDIQVKVYPTGNQQHLPEDLQILVLDDFDEVVMQAKAHESEDIQFEFSGKLGEQFSVQLMLGNLVVTQPFVI